MNGSATQSYDVTIVGAGPVGSLCALAHAQRGARVALLEANPNASKRLTGEWLHPPAVQMLRHVGVDLGTLPQNNTGRGFVVFPEDHSEPIVLPYQNESRGLACEHSVLVSCLHQTIGNVPDIDLFLHARARTIEDRQVTFTHHGVEKTITSARVVGADGRASVVRQSLGYSKRQPICSRMIGLVIDGVELPLKEYGHVVLGGPGPILAYDLGECRVRVIVDIPLAHWTTMDRVGMLIDSYASVIPEILRPGFVTMLRAGKFSLAANELRPRITYGNQYRVLIGDAAGHYHPLTAVGMTLGFGDALALAECDNFREFSTKRFQTTRTPQLLAMGLYEVFIDHRIESVALRHAVYRDWRSKPTGNDRTIDLLSCETTSVFRLSFVFGLTVVRALVREIPWSLDRLAWRRARSLCHALFIRLWWLLCSVWKIRKGRKNRGGDNEVQVRDALSHVFLSSIPSGEDDLSIARLNKMGAIDASLAVKRASKYLLDVQDKNGAWEGEMIWCPMLTAQYILLCHLMERPLNPDRRRRVLQYFEQTRLDNHTWGLHEHAPPSLFVTTLVYVALRVIGIEREDPLIKPAWAFLQTEDVLGIPTWGKFWLALCNLYSWKGVNAILPELYGLPRWIALHPSNWYCHTRLIYMAMAAIYPHRFQTPVTPLIASLREELFPRGFAEVDFSAGRNRLRDADLYTRPSRWLRAGYGCARLFERFHSKQLRTRCLEAITRSIRWELQTTNHTSISPVSGLLNILALWLQDPNDADCEQAFAKLEDWIWEDEEYGARVTGARSASWDTGFCLQALASVPDPDGVRHALRQGADFLCRHQIRNSFAGFCEAYRTDPKGGWCFAGKWHGWPVTDCTAEAVLGILAVQREAADTTVLNDAVQFMLRGQNQDGGFGSYEAQRSVIGLEWLNPSEMFGDSMTEHSFVECTASCLTALAACKALFRQFENPSVTHAISRGATWLRRNQTSHGAWRGVWGIQFIYGTFFGIRGLIATGTHPSDPALRLACRWLLDRQRDDGGWGEHHSGCLSGQYVEHEESQVIQTAWALTALLEANDLHWTAISRGAQFLLNTQNTDGTWPKQDMAGVFFRTALLDYALYRQYFPLKALGLYEQRRQAREALTTSAIT